MGAFNDLIAKARADDAKSVVITLGLHPVVDGAPSINGAVANRALLADALDTLAGDAAVEPGRRYRATFDLDGEPIEVRFDIDDAHTEIHLDLAPPPADLGDGPVITDHTARNLRVKVLCDFEIYASPEQAQRAGDRIAEQVSLKFGRRVDTRVTFEPIDPS